MNSSSSSSDVDSFGQGDEAEEEEENEDEDIREEEYKKQKRTTHRETDRLFLLCKDFRVSLSAMQEKLDFSRVVPTLKHFSTVLSSKRLEVEKLELCTFFSTISLPPPELLHLCAQFDLFQCYLFFERFHLLESHRVQDCEGLTPLHVACHFGSTRMLEQVFAKQKDLATMLLGRTRVGQTCFDLAQSKSVSQFVQRHQPYFQLQEYVVSDQAIQEIVCDGTWQRGVVHDVVSRFQIPTTTTTTKAEQRVVVVNGFAPQLLLPPAGGHESFSIPALEPTWRWKVRPNENPSNWQDSFYTSTLGSNGFCERVANQLVPQLRASRPHALVVILGRCPHEGVLTGKEYQFLIQELCSVASFAPTLGRLIVVCSVELQPEFKSAVINVLQGGMPCGDVDFFSSANAFYIGGGEESSSFSRPRPSAARSRGHPLSSNPSRKRKMEDNLALEFVKKLRKMDDVFPAFATLMEKYRAHSSPDILNQVRTLLEPRADVLAQFEALL